MRPVDLPDSGTPRARCPGAMPRSRKTLPKAMAEAMPEQNTKVSVASENPNRAGIHSVSQLPGVWAIRMMNIAIPRKKSRRGSRTPVSGAALAVTISCLADRGICRGVSARLIKITALLQRDLKYVAASMKANLLSAKASAVPSRRRVRAEISFPASARRPARRAASMVRRSNTSRWAWLPPMF